jgi:MYXO-CTERM domain-containing protein
MSKSPSQLLFSFGALAALLAVGSTAHAKDCKTAADCGKGFTCEIATVTPTPAAPPTKPCPANTACPVADPAPATTPGGTPADPTIGSCVEASCTTDTDCGATMVCHTEEIKECSGGTASTCPPNAQCLVPSTPNTCTTRSVSTCVYKWQLPCNADADCGDGFTCAPITSGYCSGGGVAGTGTATPGSTGTGSTGTGGAAMAPSPPSGGAAGSSGTSNAAVPPSDNCVTMTSFPGWCTPKATSCTADTDCPALWTCVDGPPVRGGASSGQSGVAIGAPAPQGSAANPPSIAPGEPDPNGSTSSPPASAGKMCQSPLGDTGVANASPGGIETVSGGSGGVSVPGTLPPDGVPSRGDTNGSTGSGPTAAPMAPAADSSHSTSAAAPSAGCAVGGGAGSSFAAAALAVVGLALARRRRAR